MFSAHSALSYPMCNGKHAWLVTCSRAGGKEVHIYELNASILSNFNPHCVRSEIKAIRLVDLPLCQFQSLRLRECNRIEELVNTVWTVYFVRRNFVSTRWNLDLTRTPPSSFCVLKIYNWFRDYWNREFASPCSRNETYRVILKKVFGIFSII